MGGVANVAYAMYIRPYICLICELDTVTLQLPHQSGDDHIDTEKRTCSQ